MALLAEGVPPHGAQPVEGEGERGDQRDEPAQPPLVRLQLAAGDPTEVRLPRALPRVPKVARALRPTDEPQPERPLPLLAQQLVQSVGQDPWPSELERARRLGQRRRVPSSIKYRV